MVSFHSFSRTNTYIYNDFQNKNNNNTISIFIIIFITGHPYVIGDCGGATIESRCPECNATIGGGSHQLRRDNQFAGEMDGAQFPAWSEQANLLNYQGF